MMGWTKSIFGIFKIQPLSSSFILSFQHLMITDQSDYPLLTADQRSERLANVFLKI